MILRYNLGFGVLGPRPRASIPLNLGFSIRGPVPPTVFAFGVDFEVRSPDATIFAFDGEDWFASAQRVWTGTGWFPRVL